MQTIPDAVDFAVRREDWRQCRVAPAPPLQALQDGQVLLLENLYGDIVSDLAAGLIGGLGLAPGANYGEGGAVFEAIHGSAPDIAGKGIANPVGMIWSGALMLDHLGHPDAAAEIVSAIERTLANPQSPRTRDIGGTATTTEMGKAIAEAVR